MPSHQGSSNLAVLILAGGQSKRMGTDKALLVWQGQPLLQRVATVAATCSEFIYILTPRARIETYQQAIANPNLTNNPQPIEPVEPYQYQWIAESQSGQGPVVALVQGMQAIANHKPQIEWLLVLACDLPLLNFEILKGWIKDLAAIAPSYLAYVPKLGDRWEPLCGFYRVGAEESLSSFLVAGGKSFQKWLDRVEVEAIDLDITHNQEAIEMLHNCNNPEDLC
ncbi:molybdenum cofactor guanylyltransferase [Thalassoporum mexicanum PCC 7367]|uniref:molybdenum cofactor guanylyltransferase n=1 Tax=Thalassoporum mexicanum TaxID=3457544 RepID=UPI00029FB23F|nr:molybdenum cofactor guanylyltransferase [Pseudanabaena sp. PCC 7367]AFY70602.1 molybdenum cofactor guanylyltransferase [Pseudanabaena sp. PCC 7367]